PATRARCPRMATLSVTPEAESVAAPAGPPAAIAVPAIAAETCPSCGAPVAGEWCARCGERLLREEDFSARHFFREVRGDVLDLDGRWLRSLWLVVTRPGFLTLEAFQGRRRLYLGAFRMYLAVFALLTLVSPLMTSQAEQREQSADALTRRFARLVHEIAVRTHTGDAQAKRALLETTMQHESWISFTIPLLFAVLLFALFRRRRRWFGEHLLFATHWATFNYLFGLLIFPLQYADRLVGGGVPGKAAVAVIYLATTGLLVGYMAVAFRRVYGGGRGASVAWGLVLVTCFSVAQLVVAVIAVGTAAARLAYL
ncbi:MAG TPA: DUF3667 domain-containing protein, partial [Longimicrobium sp.]|nr:DUF3667 domain-containing protein [Longimicrobium sp.]